MTLFYLPLESLEERYTAQMFRWVTNALYEEGIPTRIVTGVPLVQETEGDQFLHPANRVHFSAEQTRSLASLFERGEVQDGDVIFAADLWHFGLSGVPYMSRMFGQDLDVRLYAIDYAGPYSFDETAKIGEWARLQELSWIMACDKVFTGSEWHRRKIISGVRGHVGDRLAQEVERRLVATGLVWDGTEPAKIASDRSFEGRLVLWPHRVSETRNIQTFYSLVRELAPEFPDVRWAISTSRMNQSYEPEDERVEFIRVNKQDYYALLRDASLVLSTSLQETFGYTIHEATALGTPILCPDRSSYPETILSEENLYSSYDELLRKTVLALDGRLPVATLLERPGFQGMLREMGVPGGIEGLSHSERGEP